MRSGISRGNEMADNSEYWVDLGFGLSELLASHPPQSVTSTLTLCSCWQNQNIQAAQGWQK